MRTTAILVLFLCSACGFFDRKNKEDDTPDAITPGMAERVEAYCRLSKPAYEARRWVVDRCDGSGFTSLYALACPGNVSALAGFQDSSGKLYRDEAHTCWIGPNDPANESAAESSKDMVLLRTVAAFEQKDRAWFSSFLPFVKKNNFQFCEGNDTATTASRCILTPDLYKLMVDAEKALGGEPVAAEAEEPAQKRDGLQLAKNGFEGHLEVQKIRLKGRVYGGITDSEKGKLRAYAEREPGNGLYQAVAYRYGEASHGAVVGALEAERWPVGKLPNSRENFCDSYLFSRDMLKGGGVNPDWLPCPEREYEDYSGTDYAFAVYTLR